MERAFGVLQSRFSIVAGPTRFLKKEVLHDIMTACIIMHNMIVEDECGLIEQITNDMEAPQPTFERVTDENSRFQRFLAQYRQVKDKNAHIELKNALIEHLWEQYSNSVN